MWRMLPDSSRVPTESRADGPGQGALSPVADQTQGRPWAARHKTPSGNGRAPSI
jgi:hypothetical protein